MKIPVLHLIATSLNKEKWITYSSTFNSYEEFIEERGPCLNNYEFIDIYNNTTKDLDAFLFFWFDKPNFRNSSTQLIRNNYFNRLWEVSINVD